jgi:Tol biopolymer transport system component
MTVGTVLILAVASVRPASATIDPHDPSGQAPGPAAADAPPGSTSLISRRRNGDLATGASGQPAISSNGRWVAYASDAANIVADDGNGTFDVFVRDRRSGTTIRLPGPGGVPLPSGTAGIDPSIAADGSVVAFTIRPSASAALLAVPVSPYVVAWVRRTGVTEVVSVAQDGKLARGSGEASVSGDGRFVAYSSVWPSGRLDVNDVSDVFVRDRTARTTTLVSRIPAGGPGDAASRAPAIAADGRIVVFASGASDLVSGDDNGQIDIFARDLTAGTTSLVSVAPSGSSDGSSADPAISADGRYVAFESTASNLTPGVPPGIRAVFVRDRIARTTTLASATGTGGASIGESGQVSISGSGRIVAFASTASDLVALGPGLVDAAVIRGRTEVYAHDMISGETIRISEALDGGPGGGASVTPVIGGDGRFVAFASTSDRMVPGDDNKAGDVFLRDLPPVAVIEPAAVDFGWRSIGATGPPETITFGNDGWGPLTGLGSTVTGAAAEDYSIVVDGCAGQLLYRSDRCLVSVTFDPTVSGRRNGSLRIDHSTATSPGAVRLTGRASLATIDLDPPLGPPGIVTVVGGSGFPPNTAVHLAWSRGISGWLPPIVTDASGAFKVGMLVFHNDVVGERDLVAGPVVGGSFPAFGTRFLVVTAGNQPPRFTGGSPPDGGLPPLVMRR